MKIIAFYLPQYHTFPENDKFWGKGFTEWTNVKRAVPLYKNHYEPREPLNDNYYNLLDPKTFAWQIELAHKYGIYGFCFYHYWFSGKILMKKPMEMFLENTEEASGNYAPNVWRIYSRFQTPRMGHIYA